MSLISGTGTPNTSCSTSFMSTGVAIMMMRSSVMNEESATTGSVAMSSAAIPPKLAPRKTTRLRCPSGVTCATASATDRADATAS